MKIRFSLQKSIPWPGEGVAWGGVLCKPEKGNFRAVARGTPRRGGRAAGGRRDGQASTMPTMTRRPGLRAQMSAVCVAFLGLGVQMERFGSDHACCGLHSVAAMAMPPGPGSLTSLGRNGGVEESSWESIAHDEIMSRAEDRKRAADNFAKLELEHARHLHEAATATGKQTQTMLAELASKNMALNTAQATIAAMASQVAEAEKRAAVASTAASQAEHLLNQERKSHFDDMEKWRKTARKVVGKIGTLAGEASDGNKVGLRRDGAHGASEAPAKNGAHVSATDFLAESQQVESPANFDRAASSLLERAAARKRNAAAAKKASQAKADADFDAQLAAFENGDMNTLPGLGPDKESAGPSFDLDSLSSEQLGMPPSLGDPGFLNLMQQPETRYGI